MTCDVPKLSCKLSIFFASKILHMFRKRLRIVKMLPARYVHYLVGLPYMFPLQLSGLCFFQSCLVLSQRFYFRTSFFFIAVF